MRKLHNIMFHFFATFEHLLQSESISIISSKLEQIKRGEGGKKGRKEKRQKAI